MVFPFNYWVDYWVDALRGKMSSLFQYNGSEDWYTDQEGEKPEGLKAGVLSEGLVDKKIYGDSRHGVLDAEVGDEFPENGVI